MKLSTFNGKYNQEDSQTTQTQRALHRHFCFSSSKVIIIGLSGNSRPEQRQAALEAGMDAYLTKPYRREELIETLLSLSQ